MTTEGGTRCSSGSRSTGEPAGGDRGRLRRLAAGAFCSQLADWLAAATLVGWVYAGTGSTAQVALVLALRLVPPIAGGGIAAAVVDRLPKGRLLVALQALRSLAFAAALAGVSLGFHPAAFVAAGVTGCAAAISNVAVSSLVPAVAGRRGLPAANAIVGVALQAATAAGALGAGALLALAGVRAGLTASLVATLAAAVAFAPLGDAGRPARRRAEGFVRRGPLLVAVAAFVVATAATAVAGATFPRFLGMELGLGAGAYGIGIGTVAVGIAAGQALAGAVPALARGIGLPLLAMAALFGTLSQAPSAAVAVAALAAIGAAEGVAEVAFQTLVQLEAGAEAAGRAFAFAQTAIRLSAVGAVALAPLVNRLAGPRDAILAGALPLAAAAALTLAPNARPALLAPTSQT